MSEVSPGQEPYAVEAGGRPFGLTYREREFCLHYLRDGKTGMAYLAAGYKAKTPEKASKAGSDVLRRPKVAAFLREAILRRFDEERMENGEILARLARLGRMDPRKFFNEDGTCKSPSDLDEATAACLRGFETDLIIGKESEDGDGKGATAIATRKYKFADPIPALRTLAQISKLLAPDQQQLNVFLDLDSRMDAARKRRLAAQQKTLTVSEQ